jgi:putative transposase
MPVAAHWVPRTTPDPTFRFGTRSDIPIKVAIWFVDFYNTRHRHNACDGMSPIDYERLVTEASGPDAG